MKEDTLQNLMPKQKLLMIRILSNPKKNLETTQETKEEDKGKILNRTCNTSKELANAWYLMIYIKKIIILLRKGY